MKTNHDRIRKDGEYSSWMLIRFRAVAAEMRATHGDCFALAFLEDLQLSAESVELDGTTHRRARK